MNLHDHLTYIVLIMNLHDHLTYEEQTNALRRSSSARGQKKPKKKPIYNPKHPYISTARLLQTKK